MLKTAYYNLFTQRHLKAALAQLRDLEQKLPSAKSRFAIPFVFRGQGHFKKIRARQNPVEIEQMFDEVCHLNPERILEIGTAQGGTLYLWTQAASDNASLMSIDLPDGDFGGAYASCRAALYKSFARPGQTIWLELADSHLPESRAKVKEYFTGQPIDFAFIDGDHTYEGVKADFNDYGPLVRPGGIIAFHDILYRENQPSIRVDILWGELKEQYSCTEFIGPEGSGKKIGIGFLRVPENGIKPT
ncbi:MAG: class I SAM-dependent methyltransferase [Candidatus Polarisedimenticolaceae bacterium]|nr:class I SAM-dependent methyltransferase [Candidatus Polarisedimenticolaceae bacterium]